MKPLNVSIAGAEHPFLSGEPSSLDCVTYGSRPAANITWYHGGRVIEHETKRIKVGNVSVIYFIIYALTHCHRLALLTTYAIRHFDFRTKKINFFPVHRDLNFADITTPAIFLRGQNIFGH